MNKTDGDASTLRRRVVVQRRKESDAVTALAKIIDAYNNQLKETVSFFSRTEIEQRHGRSNPRFGLINSPSFSNEQYPAPIFFPGSEQVKAFVY